MWSFLLNRNNNILINILCWCTTLVHYFIRYTGSGAGSEKKKCRYEISSIPLLLIFPLPSHFLLALSPFALCPFSVPGVHSPNPIRVLDERCELPSRRSPADKRFLVHCELKIALHEIALLQEFLDDQVCIAICIGLRHTDIAFLRKEVAVWFWAGQGSVTMAYIHFKPWMASHNWHSSCCQC